MNYSDVLIHFLYAFFSTVGFCLLFHVPKKHIFFASLAGALGSAVYKGSLLWENSNILSCFLGACVVAVAAEVFSRAGKEAATLFIIPGIIPLVPGAGMYYTMSYFLQNDLSTAGAVGAETLIMAGSIAIALLIVASVNRLLLSVKFLILQAVRSGSKR